MGKANDKRTIFITEIDKTRLEKLLAEEIMSAKNGFLHLEGLTKELMKAKVVKAVYVPADVITMNSRVILKDVERGTFDQYMLVFPQDANAEENKVSILSPIGTAMIGCRVGHLFDVITTTGQRRMMVEQLLYQPEAAGDYHL